MILNEFFNLPQVFEKDMTEGVMSEIDAELRNIVANEDFDALYELFTANTPAGKFVQDMYDDVVIDTGLHPDDDFERIEQIVFDRLADDFGEQGVEEGMWDTVKKSFTPDPNWQRRAGQAAGHVAQGAVAGAAHGHPVGHAMADTGVAEGHADQQRKIVKKAGKPVGEVGIDRESSPGVGQWYMKCYVNGIDNSGYDSMEEALAELKHCLTQSVEEGIFDSRPSPVLPLVDKIAKVAGGLTPQNVETGKQIIQANARDITRMLSPQSKAGVNVIEGTRERMSNLHDKIRKQKDLPDPKEYLKIAQQKKKEIADLKAQNKKEVGEGKDDYVPPKEADYGPEYQAMVKRVGQKAKQQEKARQQQPKQPVRESRRALLKQIIQS